MTLAWMIVLEIGRRAEDTEWKGNQPCHPSYISVSGTNSVGTCLRSSRDRGRSAGRTLFFCGGRPPASVASKPPPSEPPRSMAERSEWHAAAVAHARFFPVNRRASDPDMDEEFDQIIIQDHFADFGSFLRTVVRFGLVEVRGRCCHVT